MFKMKMNQMNAEHIEEKHTEEVLEYDSELEDTEKRFFSVIEKRKKERRLEEGKECNWQPLENVGIEDISSKVECLLSKLKSRFNEEKEARKRAAKVNQSYYVFCNSVDSFLRHIENPKFGIKKKIPEKDLQGEGLYSLSVKPASIRNTVSSVDTPNIDEIVGHDKRNANVEMARENVLKDCKTSREKCNLSDEISESSDKSATNTPSIAGESFWLLAPPLSISASPNYPASQRLSPDDKMNLHGTQKSPLSPTTYSSIIYYKGCEAIKFSMNTPMIPFKRAKVPIHPLVKFPYCCVHEPILFYNNYTNPLFLFGTVVSNQQRNCTLHKMTRCATLMFGNKSVNYVKIQLKRLQLIAFGIKDVSVYFSFDRQYAMMSPFGMTFKSVFADVPLATCAFTSFKHLHDFVKRDNHQSIQHRADDRTKGGNPALSIENNIRYQAAKISHSSSLDDKHVLDVVKIKVDEEHRLAGDNDNTRFDKIIDESDDCSPFGIMSIYCNSEIHSRYNKVPTDAM